MAEQKSSILGDVRGKVGDVIIRKVNGKKIVSKTAASFTPSKIPHEIDKRNIMTVTGKFSSKINKNKHLHTLWNKEKDLCANGYLRISQVNYHLCDTEKPSVQAQITPPGGFKLEAEKIEIRRGNIEVLPDPVKLNKEEAEITYILVLVLWKPLRRNYDSFETLLLEKYTAEPPKLTFRLSKEDSDRAKKYKNKTIYLSALTLDKEQRIIRWSKTLAADF